MTAEGESANPAPGENTTQPESSVGKWDEKLSTASKSLEEQLRSATDAAEAALDRGISAASEAVRAGVSAASREGSAVQSRLTQFYETGVAHFEATEQQALDLLRQGVRFVREEHPDASLAAGIAAAVVLLPGPRRFLWRQTLGRFRSEEAVFRSAEQRYASLKERAEGQQGELQKLQERLQLAEHEYQRGLSKLKATAGELESLTSRVHGSSKAARGLVRDLRELPSKQALQLRSDAANMVAAVDRQAKTLEKALRRVAKQYGI